jgi:hypothetical protein
MLVILCRLLRNPLIILILAVLLLLLLWLCRDFTTTLFWLYVLFLLALGLIILAQFIARILRKICRKIHGDPKGQGSVGHDPQKRLPIPSTIYKRPDPMIYSQQYLMSQGVAVTWDNPDIQLEENGTPVSSHSVKPSTQYKILARIWNNSTQAPAVNMLVRFYYIDFGAGGAKKHIGNTYVDVAVKGSANLPAFAGLDWLSPAQPGHYCLQVELVWSDDANPLNNLGQENIDIKKLNSPQAQFEFPVRNDFPERKKFELRADCYRLPARIPCKDIATTANIQGKAPDNTVSMLAHAESNTRANLMKPHWYAEQTLPDNWEVKIEPADTFALDAGETRLVKVTVIAPDEPVDPRPVNINVFVENKLVDGVTLYVHK